MQESHEGKFVELHHKPVLLIDISVYRILLVETEP